MGWSRHAGLAGLAAIVALAACSAEKPDTASTRVVCPNTGFIADLDRTSIYDGAEQARNLLYEGKLQGLEQGCSYGTAGAEVQIKFTVAARPGPAFAGGPMTLAYFVAVEDASGTIIDKQSFPVTLSPETVSDNAASEEQLTQTIAGVTIETGPRYTVVIGFEPTDTQRERLTK